MVDKEPCQDMFKDVVEKLLSWKQDDCEILLTRDFNEDVYRRKFSERLIKDDLKMTETIQKTTGVNISPTHDRGSKAIYSVFLTAVVECKATEVFKQDLSVGVHLVFLLENIYSFHF